MKKRVEEFTSSVPVNRLLTFAKEQNKPVNTITFLESTVAKFDNKMPTTAEIGGVKVGGSK